MRTFAALLTLIVVACVVCPPQQACAGVQTEVQVGMGIPLDDLAENQTLGWMVGVRVGYGLQVSSMVELAAHTGFDYNGILGATDDAADLDVFQVYGSLRVLLQAPLNPFIFLDLGYGWMEGTGSDFVIQDSGLLLSVGGGVSYDGLPLVSLGLHGAWNRLMDRAGGIDRDHDWVDVGAHARFDF